MKRFLLALLILTPLVAFAAKHVTLRITNPTCEQRQELVGFPIDTIRTRLGITKDALLVVTNAIGQEQDWQITASGQLLIDVSAQPGQTVEFTVEAGVPHSITSYALDAIRTRAGGIGVGRVWASGRLYPDRLDDVAWENDRGAYRVYGPAFQRSGQYGYGPDVWLKNTPLPDIDHRFRMDIDTKETQHQLARLGLKEAEHRMVQDMSFHVDHGSGNDCYAVGKSLGCGGPAIVLKNKQLLFQRSWKTYEITDNGPLRFTVHLTFPDTLVDGKRLTEHRIYTLDKGSNFNRVELWYEGAGKLQVATGFPLHSPNEATCQMGDDFMQYADPTENTAANACEIYVACLYPYNKITTAKEQGHALAFVNLKAGEHFTYFAGTAWSKYDVRNQREWQARIATALNQCREPLQGVIAQ